MTAALHDAEKTHVPDIPRIIAQISFACKGCSNTYKLLFSGNNFIIENIRIRWSSELNEEISTYRIERALQNIKKTPVNAYAKYILFKLQHPRIVTN